MQDFLEAVKNGAGLNFQTAPLGLDGVEGSGCPTKKRIQEVVGNDMDAFAFWLRGDDLFQEPHKLHAGVTPGGLAEDFSALSFQGRRRARASRGESIQTRAIRHGPARAARTGSRRLRAWKALFSSTQKTAVWAGGANRGR